MGAYDMGHMDYLGAVSAADVAHLNEKEATYRGSWKKRGGVGAAMMAARKWDRLEVMLSTDEFKYDIFAAIAADPSGRDGCALAEIRDLRRYLLLIEAEMVSRGVVAYGPSISRSSDNGMSWKADPPPVMPTPQPRLKTLADLKAEMNDRPSAWAEVLDRTDKVRGGATPPSRPPVVQRIEDGLLPAGYIAAGVTYLTTFDHRKIPHYIVNRISEPREKLDHLPRLAVELNNKEYEETQPQYQGLYAWSGEKWVMHPDFQECWGKET
jgi:hypothetical protein